MCLDFSLLSKNVQSYIDGLNQSIEAPELDSIYEQAVGNNIPVVRKTTGKLLYFIIKIKEPKNVLEIGTGSGYSSLWIYKGLPQSSCLITLERDKKRYLEAEKLFRNYPGIELINIDAFDYFKKVPGHYDFVFLDAQKRDYLSFLNILRDRINSGGILFVDNFLFNGRVLEISSEDEEKYRGGVEFLKQFNQELCGLTAFESLFLSVDDGIVVARKR